MLFTQMLYCQPVSILALILPLSISVTHQLIITYYIRDLYNYVLKVVISEKLC